MKIWTGKIFLLLAFVAVACSSADKKAPAKSEELDEEVKLAEDRKALEELRKDVPEDTRRVNDRLAETLNRWKQQKMAPETLRERFYDEIRKQRQVLDKRQRRKREDFQRQLTDKRKEFQDKLKEERDDFLGHRPKGDRRSDFMNKQSIARNRFDADIRDERQNFEEDLKDERKTFEDDMAHRQLEFRQEYPEYLRNYNEMKADEERRREEAQRNPKPYTEWPYKDPDAKPTGSPTPPPEAVDVNKGGGGWPATDPEDFDKMNKPQQGP